MNRKYFTLILAALFVAGMSGDSLAQLSSRGNRLIYDADLDITFYNFTYGPTGWSAASSWASALVVEGYDDWRLPKMKNDPPNFGQDCALKPYSDTSTSADRGWNKASSELGHLFFEELDGVSNYPVNDCANPNRTFGLVNGTGPFTNLLFSGWFWMSNPEFGGSHHWVFNVASGSQGTADNNAGGWAIAVRDGDVRSVQANTLEADSLALVALYNSTNGASWTDHTNWLTGSVASWYGVTVSGDRITRLTLNENNLSGPIPSEIGDLSSLNYLYLYTNKLTGAIPVEIGNLTNLSRLYLHGNQLTGGIPVEIGNLTDLAYLTLSGNQLTGEIPAEIGNLTNLIELWLRSNQLTGEIPAETGNLTILKKLNLYNNQLSGGIPATLGNLYNLEYLYLDSNQLTGSIPSQLGGLTTNLTELWLSHNQLTGEIPTTFGALGNLTKLSLWDNQLTGEIPYSLRNMSSLTRLDLDENQLTGEIPVWWEDLSNLTELFLNGNLLTGEIPTVFGNMPGLTRLQLAENQLTGSIPASLGNITSLTELLLYGNQLTGEIPTALGNLSNLIWLKIGDNQLTGGFPTELRNLTGLKWLHFNGNQLDGEIPTWLGSLQYLEKLYLDHNQLTGTIPVELGSLTNLRVLSLWSNQLSGEIPVELGNLQNLEDLGLSDNQLTGEIPAEIGNLTNLTSFYLHNNASLYGTLPTSLVNLTSLGSFHFYGTGLCSPLDPAFQSWMLGIDDLQGTGCSAGDDRVVAQDSLALVALYNSTDGANWTEKTNWLTGRVSSWNGITVTGDRVMDIGLGNNNLSGPLPSQIGNLTSLQTLVLATNQLTGGIPLELGNLTNLQNLNLSSNQLSGGIPAEIGNLINLTSLTFQDNPDLSGTLPLSLTNLTSLGTFHFSNTGLCSSPDGAFQAWIQGISDTSGSVCADTTPPADPTGASGSAGDGEVTINWTANTEPDFDYYRIYRDTSPAPTTLLTTVPAGSTTYTDTGLTNGTTYYYRITAVDTSGNESGFSQEVSEVPQAAADTTPPADPTGASGSAGDGEVTINWTANTEPDFDYYRIYRGTSPAPTTLLATVPAGSTTYTDTGLTNGTTYYYRITAVDTSGNESGFSQEVSEVPQAAADTTAPAIPTGLSLSSSDASISLSWSTVGDVDLASYRLYRGTNPSPTSLITTISAGTTTYTDTGLANGTRYYYRITAVDASGNESAYSQERDSVPVQAQITVVRSQSFGSATLTSNFRMISLPGNGSTSVSSTFSGTAGSDWTAYWDSGSTSEDYLVDYSASTTFRFTPGRGFWAISKNGWDVSSRTVNQVSLSSDGTYSISLHDGWNIIGNPFEFSISWSFTTSLNSTSGTLNSYTGSYSSSSRLEPYRGYYFFNRDGLTSLKIPYLRESSSGKTLEAGKQNNLLISSLVAHDLDGGLKVDVGYGSAQDALEGIDDYDRFAPPGYFDDLTMVIVSPEARYGYSYLSRDVRPPVKEDPVFDLLVMSSEPRTLEFELKNPEDRQALPLYLIDPHGTIYSVGQQPVSIPVQSPKQSFTAVVGSLDLAESISSERLPLIPALESLHPNPSSSGVSVEYVLPEDGHAVLMVYDVLGRKVATLVDGLREKGMHRIQWSGRDANNQKVSSGLYFIKLNVGATTTTRSLIRLR